MSADTWRPNEVLSGMMREAKAKALWFFCTYQQLWFSPQELEQHWQAGKFRWGADNWDLRNPEERLIQLEAEAYSVEKAKNDFLRRMGR